MIKADNEPIPMIAVNGRTVIAMDLRVVMDMALIIPNDSASFIHDI